MFAKYQNRGDNPLGFILVLNFDHFFCKMAGIYRYLLFLEIASILWDLSQNCDNCSIFFIT